MRAAPFAAFLLGIAGLVLLAVRAGAGAIVQALVALKLDGLLLVAAIHLPIVALLGLAWWLIGSNLTRASRVRTIWARLVRDAAAEALPFSQVGGFVLGLHALNLGDVKVVPAATSMGVDLILELWAKIPYLCAGLAIVFFAFPQAALVRVSALALGLTLAVAAFPLLLRGQLRQAANAVEATVLSRWPHIARAGRDRFEDSFHAILTRRDRLSAGVALHLFCWFLGAGETWVMLVLMGRRLSLLDTVALDSLVSGLRTFGFLVPAAAGVQEAGYVLVGALFGLPGAAALALSLVRRAREVVIAVPTFAAWQYLELRARRARDLVSHDAA